MVARAEISSPSLAQVKRDRDTVNEFSANRINALEDEIIQIKGKLAESERIRTEYIRETIVGGPMRRGKP